MYKIPLFFLKLGVLFALIGFGLVSIVYGIFVDEAVTPALPRMATNEIPDADELAHAVPETP